MEPLRRPISIPFAADAAENGTGTVQIWGHSVKSSRTSPRSAQTGPRAREGAPLLWSGPGRWSTISDRDDGRQVRRFAPTPAFPDQVGDRRHSPRALRAPGEGNNFGGRASRKTAIHPEVIPLYRCGAAPECVAPTEFGSPMLASSPVGTMEGCANRSSCLPASGAGSGSLALT